MKKNFIPYACRNNVAILNIFYANGVPVFSFKKYGFADRAFTLMLVYRNQFMEKQEFFQMLQYLVTTY